MSVRPWPHTGQAGLRLEEAEGEPPLRQAKELDGLRQERRKLADWLRKGEDPWERFPAAPRSRGELAALKGGWHEAADGGSLLQGGFADYALALLSGWDAFGEALDEGGTFSRRVRAIVRALREERRLPVYAPFPLQPERTASGERAPLLQPSADGLLLTGVQPVPAEALLAAELLLAVPEQPDGPPSALLLVPIASPGAELGPWQEGDAALELRLRRVLVPQERVLVQGDADRVRLLLSEPPFAGLADFQRAARELERLGELAGLAFALAERGGRTPELELGSRLGLLVQRLETQRALLLAAEREAAAAPGGVWLPAEVPLYAALAESGAALREAAALLPEAAGWRIAVPMRSAGRSGAAASADAAASEEAALAERARCWTSGRRARELQLGVLAWGSDEQRAAASWSRYPADRLRGLYRSFWQSWEAGRTDGSAQRRKGEDE
ncbi:4-hydroxyphenylacetate 3-hydroxylase C-terminal domain-containing protein [Paenibacillus sp. B01]|uniref:4-hydroxyphenylacetate 3-hydroxylase C-terminal domain-containing protein n=1 Tax=Paenibacillus sp. B01 TaxID=2660554 RepID=UPI00129B08F6|nr:4-hydroxyphenylacetate 3-hydroxylase C-terminal domain-containing protein [Paenibacillus sp. B01]QGG57697.1 hypothetical protein GE073_20265 [Paenibacillus sp. B01]